MDIMRVAKDLGESFTLDEIREMIDEADRNGEKLFLMLLLKPKDDNILHGHGHSDTETRRGYVAKS